MKKARSPLPPAMVMFLFLPAILTPILFISVRHWSSHSSGHDHGVAPWDYPDEANPVPIANPGPLLPEPAHVVQVKDNAYSEPDGFSLELDHVSKGNTVNWLHWWTPDGGPLPKKPGNAWSFDQPDQPPLKVGRQRELDFNLKLKDPETVDYIGYVPDGARSGLTAQEQVAHGWDSTPRIYSGSFQPTMKVLVTVDDPKASRFMFGLARGTWTAVTTVKNKLGTAEPDGQLIAEGTWGTARYAKKRKEPMAFSKHIDGITIELKTPSEPVNEELRIRGFDATGAEIPITTVHGVAFKPGWAGSRTKPVETFTVESRPYTYYEFDGIHYDPDPDQWKEFAWGQNPPTNKVEIGDVTAELQAIAHTEPVNDAAGARYKADKIYTIDNRVWRDAPEGSDNMSSPMTEPLPTFNPETNRFDPPAKYPRPMLATFLFHSPSTTAEEKPIVRFAVFGSDSQQPGKDLHADWNHSVIEWGTDKGMKPLNQWACLPFSLSPEAKYVQFKFEIAEGPWHRLAEVKPEAVDFTYSPVRRFNRTTLLLAQKIEMRKIGTNGNYDDRVLSQESLAGLDTRVFAHLKDGSRRLLRITSYNSLEASSYWPGYDFDLDVTDVNRVNIDPLQIESFEIEARPIKQGFLAYKPPTDR